MSKKEVIIGGYGSPRMKLWDYDTPEELPNNPCLGEMAMVNGNLVIYFDKNKWSGLTNNHTVIKYLKCDRCEKWIDSYLIMCPHCGLVDSVFI